MIRQEVEEPVEVVDPDDELLDEEPLEDELLDEELLDDELLDESLEDPDPLDEDPEPLADPDRESVR